MPNDLIKATPTSLDIGIDEFSPDLSPEINLDFESQNLTSGVYRGIGPRVGMQTLPGQMGNEALASNANNNMRQSEESLPGTPARCLNLRYGVLNIFPFNIASYSDIRTEITAYAWLLTSQGRNQVLSPVTGKTNLSLILNSTYVAASSPVPQQFPYTDDMRDGFHVPQGLGMSPFFPAFTDTNSYIWNPTNLFVESSGQAGASTKSRGTDTLLVVPEGTAYVPSISVSFSGRINQMKYMVGDTTGSTASATTPPKMNFWKFLGNIAESYPFQYSNGCVSSCFQKDNFRTIGRYVRVFAFGAQSNANVPNEFVAAYTVKCIDIDLAYSAVWNYLDAGGSNYHADFTNGATNTVNLIEGPIGAYNTIKTAMLEDELNFTSTAFKAVLAAPGKAICWILQDWLRSPEGMLPQVVDLTSHAFTPPDGIKNVGTPTYSENGIPVTTAFANFPDYVENTPLALAYGVGLSGVAGSGIFRANTVYELGYSYYNKRLDFETNVGTPVKFRTGATDFVALQVTNTTGAIRGGQPRYTQSEAAGLLFWEFGNFLGQTQANQLNLEINSTEIRFYYRKFGSFEWLPLYFVDAAKWWFYPFFIDPAVAGTGLVFGENPIAALPGGQPGGFVDYSKLPNLEYNCVLSFQDRIWWFASDSVNFSLRNNMFSYPVRNSISCRTGNFLGGIVHNYPGQAQQSSRLLIFGTKEVYVARFTGVLNTSPVQVSDDTIGEYPVDASDLVVDTWTTNTAFSFRSAIIAEGIAYWWGPTGVYRDDGVNTPKKISLRLEPTLLTVYDPTDIKNIHCSYDQTAKEITWYYRAKESASFETEAITYNLIDEEWLVQYFDGVIDTVFPVQSLTNMNLAGNRNVMVSRRDEADLISRAYYYDARCHGYADLYPQRDMVIKSITTPVTNQRRITLAAGYNLTNFATIAAGDLIALKNIKQYAASMTLAESMLCEVIAVNTGGGYLDIRIPKGAQIDASATLAVKEYFPIYHKTKTGVGLNGFVWRLKTKYWLPFGINFFANWLWLYLLHKIELVKSDGTETYQIGYRTVTSGDFVYDDVIYKNNSDGNWQLYHALRTALTNNQGQALKLDLTGIQIASDLVIQFLEAHITEETGNDLKQFEG